MAPNVGPATPLPVPAGGPVVYAYVGGDGHEHYDTGDGPSCGEEDLTPSEVGEDAPPCRWCADAVGMVAATTAADQLRLEPHGWLWCDTAVRSGAAWAIATVRTRGQVADAS